MIQRWRFAAWSLFASYSLLAQNPAWQPSASHTQLPIWPANPPDAAGPPANTETAEVEGSVAARPWLDVASPSYDGGFFASRKEYRGVVIVLRGGGYEDLAIDLVRQGRVRARALTATRRLWIHSSVLEASV